METLEEFDDGSDRVGADGVPTGSQALAWTTADLAPSPAAVTTATWKYQVAPELDDWVKVAVELVVETWQIRFPDE